MFSKKNLVSILGLLMAFSFSAACGTEENVVTASEDETAISGKADQLNSNISDPLIITEENNGQAMVITEGRELLVRLAANYSTGFGWKVTQTDRTFGYPKSEDYIPNSYLVGSDGVAEFLWATSGAFPMLGKHDVTMEYSRPWEKDVAPAKTFTFTVDIQKKSAVACTMQYDPVCGVDNKTYGNECQAMANGVRVAYKGECAVPQNVCRFECQAIGTKSEGWYKLCGSDEPVLVNYAQCEKCEAICKYIGTRSEGYYSSCDDELLGWTMCGSAK